jgi:hypothetical protein
VTTSSWVGRSKPGCDLGPALSFKDLHHPGWGGGRAEPELYLPCGFVGHLLPQHSRERALTGLAGGSDFDNAGLVGGECRQLQRVGLALARLPVPPPAARAVVAPRAPEDCPRRRALLGRRSCSGALSPRGPSNVGGCSYPRRRNRSSVCNGTLSAGVCSLWLSGPEHVCILGTEPCFFLIPSTRTRLSAN